MNILGISAFYHDSAACLVQNGDIVAAAQEERFTRKKNDPSFPKNAINYCLHEAGIQGKDLDLIAFYDKPFIKFERILETYLTYAPFGVRSFVKAMPLWLKQKLWIKEYIKKELKFDKKILFPEHHESHAAAAFFPSPFKEAAILTIDGVGEWATASYGTGKNNIINIMAEIHFPHSLGLLYSAFTFYTGFKVNSDEYKVMGLAPYGEPIYKDLILSKLMDLKEDGSFKLNMSYFDYGAGLTMTNKRFEKLFGGPPRKPEDPLTKRDMDLARSVQEVAEEVMLRMAKHVHKVTGQKYLCLAGGVALNCVGNGKVLREGPFSDIWIQPAAGDAGGALGAALAVWFKYLKNDRVSDDNNDLMQGTYLGPKFDNKYISNFLKTNNIPYSELSEDQMPKKISDLIADQKVIGWFQGRMEFGPRALGARSIIGDARSPLMQKLINNKIKFRENFRPFAPSILKERVSEYFDIDRESPYMLVVAPLKKEVCRDISEKEKALTGLDKLKVIRSIIPAVTHVDFTARVHTVSKEKNPPFYNMIKTFENKYGCPVIINTSFNIQGEPIVCTPEDAFSCFMRTNMDHLLLGDFLLEKKDQRPVKAEKIPIVEKKHTDTPKKVLREFGITMSIMLAILGIIFFMRGTHFYPLIAVLSAVFLLLGILSPNLLASVQKAWMIFSEIIGWISTNIILTLLFYIVVTPIAVTARSLGKYLLDVKFNNKTNTYWRPKDTIGSKNKDYESQF